MNNPNGKADMNRPHQVSYLTCPVAVLHLHMHRFHSLAPDNHNLAVFV